jgi:hypothetical protein
MIGQGLGRVALAERLSISQLEEAIQNRTIPAYIGIPLLEEKTQLEERMRAAQMGMTPQPEMTIADQVMQQANMAQGGIDEIPVEMEMAGGGIVAFEDGGQVQRFQNQGLVGNMTEEELQAQDLGIAPPMPPEQPIVQAAPPQQMFAPLDPNEILTQTEALYGGLYGKGSGAAAPGDKLSYVSKAEEFFKQAGVDLNLAAKQAADIAAEKEALGKDREEAKKMRIIEAGFAILGGTSPNAFENIGKGATQALKGYTSDIKDLQKTERELGDATRKMMQAQNQIRMGVATAAGEDYQKAVERYNAAKEKMADRKAGLAEKLISNRTSQQIVEAQMRSKPSDVLGAACRSCKRSGMSEVEATKLILGASKTGALTPALLEKEFNDFKITQQMKYKKLGINTPKEYAAWRLAGNEPLESGIGGGSASAANDIPLGLRNP